MCLKLINGTLTPLANDPELVIKNIEKINRLREAKASGNGSCN